MKQTMKFSGTMVLLLAAMTMMGEESEINAQMDNLLAVENLYNDKSDPKKDKADSEVQPLFAERGDMVYMSLKNPDLGTVHIEVRDGLNRLIYSETISETERILKAFNFKKAFQGYYTIKLDYGSNSISKEIEIS